MAKEIILDSPIKVLTSSNPPTKENLQKGEIAIQYTGWDSYGMRIYGNGGNSILSIQGIETIPVTYEKLIDIIGRKELFPGCFYRLYDYECTLEGMTASEEKGDNGFDIKGDTPAPFDLILQAISTDALSEECWACRRLGDTYFPATTRFEQWRIWYTPFNDKNRFPWAKDGGKGLIYRMIDEHGIECPYDFKNVRMRRSKFLGSFADKLGEDYYFTFSRLDGRNNIFDATLEANSNIFNVVISGMSSDNGPKEDVSPSNAVFLLADSSELVNNVRIDSCHNLTLGVTRLTHLADCSHIFANQMFAVKGFRSMYIDIHNAVNNSEITLSSNIVFKKFTNSCIIERCNNIEGGSINGQKMKACEHVYFPETDYGGGCIFENVRYLYFKNVAPYYSTFRNILYLDADMPGQYKTVENIVGTQASPAEFLTSESKNGTTILQKSDGTVVEVNLGDLAASGVVFTEK